MLTDMLLERADEFDDAFNDLIEFIKEEKGEGSGFVESALMAKENLLLVGEAFDALANLAGSAVTPVKLAAIITGAKLFTKSTDSGMKAASDSYEFYSLLFSELAESIGISVVSMRVPPNKGGDKSESASDDNA